MAGAWGKLIASLRPMQVEGAQRFATALLSLALVASACTDGSNDPFLVSPDETLAGPADGTDRGGVSAEVLRVEVDEVDGPGPAAPWGEGRDPRDVPSDAPLPAIRVDQFGYRPGDPKVAVIADPQVGVGSELNVDIGETIEVRRLADDEIVLSGSPLVWADGGVHQQSGDRGWWFDFSSLDQPGTYYLTDPTGDHRSHPFDIGDDVYDQVLRAALRMFWYNRGNTDHPTELSGPWADGVAYLGEGQDAEARSVDAQDDPATALDLSGGWFDAGDTNKYVTFATQPVHGLLTIYQRHPDLFDDDLGIPESGNGIPDIVDEIKWELDWLERMQRDDGGVLIKMGSLGHEHELVPSAEFRPRFYEEVCSSATIAAAGMFAHGALVLQSIPQLAGDARRLGQRAARAWDWYQANPKRDDCDPRQVKSGDADAPIDEQAQQEVVAAIYLFTLTGDDRYQSAIRSGVDQTLPLTTTSFGEYAPDQADALLAYRDLPGADPEVVDRIDSRIDRAVDGSELFGFDDDADLYRAHMNDSAYHWGSNRVKANIGAANLMIDSVPDGPERALAHLNYLHGVNPLGLVYLSNMSGLGAERSAQFLFHYWFGDDTDYDINRNPTNGVAPGYVVGGPNRRYRGASADLTSVPPQKAYLDQPGYVLENVWELTEPAIYYQSAYLRLLTEVLGS